jgi:capsular polysaccharide biosynthesis protein
MNHRRLLQTVPGVVKRVLHPLLRRIYLENYVLPEQALVKSLVDYLPEQSSRRSTALGKVSVLAPEEKVIIADPQNDPFVAVGKYYREGSFVRPPIFVCDLPDAYLHVGTGMVCTRNWEVVPDFEYRLADYPQIRQPKPRQVKRLTGNYATIFSWNGENFGHWMFDFLPRIHSLAKAEPREKLVIIMPDYLRPTLRESLDCLLPPNFVVEYRPREPWLQLENFVWSSVVSERCNFFLPAEYFEAIRQPIFARFGLPAHHSKTRRIFVTRRHAVTRRVLNEAAVASLLEGYGFESVELSELSFRQQVELFHQADIVVGPHGAGLSSIVFSGNIRLVVFYATQMPLNHWHTLAKGLGQEHHFVLHHAGEDDDLTVNLEELDHVLKDELGLKPSHGGT